MKLTRKLVILLVTVLLLTATLCACSSAEKDILGTWEHSTTTLGITTSTTFTFNEDGTGTKTTLLDVVATEFTYEIKDDTLIVTTNVLGIKDATVYRFAIDGDKLTLTDNSDKATIYTKKA